MKTFWKRLMTEQLVAALKQCLLICTLCLVLGHYGSFSMWVCSSFAPFFLFLLQVVLPYFVATKMSKIRKGNIFAPSPETYVCNALNTVGLQSRTFGYWFHAVQVGPFWLGSVFNLFTASQIGQPSVPHLEQMLLCSHMLFANGLCAKNDNKAHIFMCVVQTSSIQKGQTS